MVSLGELLLVDCNEDSSRRNRGDVLLLKITGEAERVRMVAGEDRRSEALLGGRREREAQCDAARSSNKEVRAALHSLGNQIPQAAPHRTTRKSGPTPHTLYC